MPTPVGHALAGLTTAWLCHSRRVAEGPLIACVVAAVAPDVDILFHSHRMYAHSIGAVLIVGLVAWLVVRNWGAAFTIAAAYGTHVLLDWLARDSAPPLGLMALWPFSTRFYLSGADLFLEVSRRYWKPDEFIWGNLKSVAWEVLLLAPVATLAWTLQRRRSSIVHRPSSIVDD